MLKNLNHPNTPTDGYSLYKITKNLYILTLQHI